MGGITVERKGRGRGREHNKRESKRERGGRSGEEWRGKLEGGRDVKGRGTKRKKERIHT